MACGVWFRNPDGSAGTRNLLGIATTVQCVAPTVDYAVRRIRQERGITIVWVEHIMGDAHVKEFFRAMFRTTFPYERRWPGTDNDTLQTRALQIPFDSVTTPTLILHGTHDGDVPIEDSEYAATRIRDAQHYWAADDDHLGFWLSPRSGDMQQAVRTFLNENAPR